MFVSHKSLNSRHLTTDFFQRGEERKQSHLAQEEAKVGNELVITAYGAPLILFKSFNYLGRVLLVADDDWTALVNNLWRARQKWVKLTRVLRR